MNQSPVNQLILSHGRESGPNASKITRLDALASARGYQCQRPDYGMQAPAAERIEKLLDLCTSTASSRILVGSSMGAYISAMASLHVDVAGLFLLAPPIFFRGTEAAMRLSCAKVTIIHGWHDELIDPSEVIGFARAYDAKLVLVNDDHRLKNSMAAIEHEFALFLSELDIKKAAV